MKQVVEAARRIMARPAERKAPLDSEMVRKLVNRLQRGNLAELQLATLIALGFFGFLRWGDLSNLTYDSIHFEGSHIALLLEKRNNNQFRDRWWVFISSLDVQPCPVAVVRNLSNRVDTRLGPSYFGKYSIRRMAGNLGNKACHTVVPTNS